MSEHKSWLWKRRSSDKTTDKEDPSSKAHKQEIHKLLAEKAELEKDLKDLNDKLSSALSDSNANDELAKKNAKAAQEALADWERAEAKAHALKQELTEALDQKLATEERASQLDAALKECMQQLRFVREEQVRRVQDVLEKSEKDYEQKRSVLESKLLESSKRIAELDDELVELSRVLFHKDQLIEGLNQLRAKAEADIEQLIKRAESAEKASASLRYEVRVLEKEIEIRNEERDFNRVTADAAHKQHLENSKKIAKLESECQRLRVLVRKRLPGPAALAKMKNEVDVLERGPRKRLVIMSNEGSAGRSNSRLDYSVDHGSSPPDSLQKKINVLVERLCALEEDNNGLQEALMKMADELQVSKNMYARTATKLAQVESQLDESKKTQMIMELSTRRNGHGRTMSSHDFSIISDMETDDKGSCAGSWALASVTELEKHKDGKEKGARQSCISEGASEINLMDDFVEMEKLALVCVDKPVESSTVSVTGSKLALVGLLDNVTSDRSPGDTTGKEIVPVSGPADVKEKPKLETSVSKLIEIIEGINLSPQDDRDSSTCYTVRVFRWKTPELALEIQELLHCCYDSLNGKADFQTFAQRAASALDWIINHCLSVEDVSNVKDAIRKQFDCKESTTENEPELGISKLLGPRGPPDFSVTSPTSYQGDFPQEELQKDKVSDIVKVKDEIKLLESSRREMEQKLGSTIDDGKPLPTPILESQQSEKQDLNKPICTGSESENDPKDLSSPENGAKNKAEDCKEAEATCLELQLQTEGAMEKDVSEEHKNQEEEKQLQIVSQEHIKHEEEKGLQTDWEIATASEKLAQCQEAILHLGKQLKALAPPHEASLFEKVMSSTTNTTAMTKSNDSSTQSTISTTQHKKNLSQRPCLLDRLLAEEDDVQAEELIESPQTKEIVVYASNQKRKPMGVRNGSLDSSLDMYEQKSSRTDSMKQNSFDRPVIGSLAIVPVSKRQNSGGLFKKLLRRKVK